MQTPDVFQEAMQTVIEAPLWLKAALPLLGMLIRHFWPQSGALIDKVLSLLGRRAATDEKSPDEPMGSIVELIERLLAQRAKAAGENDVECVERCNHQLQSLFEMLK